MNTLSFITLKSFNISPIKPENKTISKQELPDKTYEIKIVRDSISGYYQNDLNLIELNACILEILESCKKEELVSLNKIKLEEEFKISKPQYRIDRADSLRLIEETREKIEMHTNNQIIQDYKRETKKLLDEYNKIGSLKKYITFGRDTNINVSEESTDKKIHRLSLIEDFLETSKKYININIYRKMVIKGCSSCGYDISNLINLDLEENEAPFCPSCNIEITQLVKYKSSSEGSMRKSGGSYEGRINFQKELSRYQGKLKNNKVPSNLDFILDTYFKQRDYPIGETIRQNPELLKKTSKDLMYKALKTVGLSNLYKDVNLVCHLYWGWSLINLESLESKIMKYYDQINEVFEQFKDDRSSSLNTQYELWWILTLSGYPCEPKEFKMPKTPEIFEYHEKKRAEICRRLGWEYSALSLNDI